MAKKMIKKVGKYATLYRDNKTGITWIEDGSTGCEHSCHPSINASGSVNGMKKLGYWNKSDKVVKSHGWKFNISKLVFDNTNEYDKIVVNECMCELCMNRRKLEEI